MTVETKKHGAHRAPLQERSGLMSKLGQVVEAVEQYNQFVLDQVKRARADERFAREVIDRWHETKSKTPVTHTPTGFRCRAWPCPKSMSRAKLPVIFLGTGCRASFHFSLGFIAKCISSRFARSKPAVLERMAKAGMPSRRSARSTRKRSTINRKRRSRR